MSRQFLSGSEAETFDFARALAAALKPPARILLYGELGAGKTTFTKGLAAGFDVADLDDVSSPTFTLVNEYRGRAVLYHVDLYRVSSDDLYDLGLDDFFDDPGSVVVIEWAERLGDAVPEGALRVRLSWVDETTRRIEVEG